MFIPTSVHHPNSIEVITVVTEILGWARLNVCIIPILVLLTILPVLPFRGLTFVAVRGCCSLVFIARSLSSFNCCGCPAWKDAGCDVPTLMADANDDLVKLLVSYVVLVEGKYTVAQHCHLLHQL